MSGLNAYLEQKTAAIERTRELARTDPEAGEPGYWRRTLTATSVADDATGLRKTQLRQFGILVDGATTTGGFDVAPGSPDLLVGALSSCLVHTVLVHAAQLGIPVEQARADVSATLWTGHVAGIESDEPIGPRSFDARLAIDAPEATEAQRQQLAALVDAACLLVQTLRRPNEVTITLVDGADGQPAAGAA